MPSLLKLSPLSYFDWEFLHCTHGKCFKNWVRAGAMLSHLIPQCLVPDRIPIKLQLTGKSRLILILNFTSYRFVDEWNTVIEDFESYEHKDLTTSHRWQLDISKCARAVFKIQGFVCKPFLPSFPSPSFTLSILSACDSLLPNRTETLATQAIFEQTCRSWDHLPNFG